MPRNCKLVLQFFACSSTYLRRLNKKKKKIVFNKSIFVFQRKKKIVFELKVTFTFLFVLSHMPDQKKVTQE